MNPVMLQNLSEPNPPAELTWSVMLPVYRPEPDYLRQALTSVLQQDPGPERMEIVVVDDCTPEGDVAALVKSIAGDRVACVRNERNLGLAGCWNKCIQIARGRWIHLLHQDDFVSPGFYEKLEQAATLHPEVSLLATRSFFVDELSRIIGLTSRVPELENGGNDVRAFFYENPLQCPGVAVKKSFYSAHGDYRTDLNYTLDCEMWVRVINTGGGVVLADILSSYRVTSVSSSARMARSAQDIADLLLLHQLWAGRYPEFNPQRAKRLVLEQVRRRITSFQKSGDQEAVQANTDYWRKRATRTLRLAHALRRLLRRLLEKFYL
jgi:glycosyltransferase involved in cell wall biosynthesis